MKFIKYFILSSCLLLTLFSCTRQTPEIYYVKQELASINLVDRNGMSETISQKERLNQYANIDFLKPQSYQKVLRVFSRDSSGAITAIITSYYPNGHIKQYLEVKDHRAFGHYREWYSDGVLKLETYVMGGIADLNIAAEKSWLFDGISKAYDDCGNLSAEIEYCKGELTGFSRYYHKNGNIWKIVPFRKNMIEGNFEIYLENGELLQTSEFVNDLRNGKTLRYFALNKLAADETYLEGNLTDAKYFNFDGSLASEITCGDGLRAVFGKIYICELQEYKNGQQEGKIEAFDVDALSVKIYHTKNQMKHGEEIEFYSNTKQPKISIQWHEGKIQGIVKTFYENGGQESQREMTNNLKNGILTAWYKDGSLMLLESYDHDKLIKGKYFKRQDKTIVSEVTNGNGVATLYDSDGYLIKKIHYFNGKPQD